jgi:transcriptional regulator with XRE-family HTH domain
MEYYSMTDQGIAKELGSRVRSLRLRRNVTQEQLSEATALSLNVIKSLESGKAKLTSLIAVLRELGSLDDLDRFIPEITISPLQLARRRGKQRQRASGRRLQRRPMDDAAW